MEEKEREKDKERKKGLYPSRVVLTSEWGGTIVESIWAESAVLITPQLIPARRESILSLSTGVPDVSYSSLI
jgi:hypothetical protein